MKDTQEKAYWNHEVSKILSIGESTLRKWCIELEKNGYEFIRGAKESRAFTDHDISALTFFKELTKVKNRTQSEAAKLVVSKFQRDIVSERTPPIPQENNHSGYDNLEKMLKEVIEKQEKQEQLNYELVKKLDEQNTYIREVLEKRDQLLLESIRNTLEEKKSKKKR